MTLKAKAAAAILLFASQLAFAEDRPEEYQAMRRRIAQDRVRVRFLQKEEASILKGLMELERAIEAKQAAMGDLADLIEKVEARIDRLDARIAENDREIAVLRRAAGRRAAAMLRLRRTNLASIIARVSDRQDVRRLRDRMRLVLAYDANLISAARAATAEDRRLKGELAGERRTLNRSKEELAAETEEALLLKEQRAALLEAIRQEKSTYQRLARELRSAANRLEAELGVVRGLEPAPEQVEGGFSAQKGRLPWPVAGRVEMTFGKRVEPESGMVMVSKGIDLRAPQSDPVRAVFQGKVAYADRLEGYGRLVILEHPGGWYTLYAHLESFAVKRGQPVNQHQVLGFVGDTGSTKGAYLYFEMRQGRRPVDPLRWLVR